MVREVISLSFFFEFKEEIYILEIKNENVKKLQVRIMSNLLTFMSELRNIEEEGYIADEEYMSGLSYWYYKNEGRDRITVMKLNKQPMYPQGDWHLVAMTMDGDIEIDNSYTAAYNILQIDELEAGYNDERWNHV